MSDHGQQQPRPAYCEEFSEETQATLSDTRQSASVAAKKHSTSVVGKSKSKKGGRDEQSDSGYSSHTHSAPNSSLDSRIEAANSQLPPPPPPPAPSAPPAAAVPVATPASENTAKQPKSRAHSPEKNVLKRTGSKSRTRRDGESRRVDDCPCEECASDPRRSAVPIRPTLPATYAIAQPRQKTPGPPPPLSRRPEPLMPTREHVRPRPSASRARPMSFHAGTMPEPLYLAQPQYIVERQPPVRQAAYPFPPSTFPPPQPYMEPMMPMQTAPPLPLQQQFYAQPQIAPMAYEILPEPRPRPRRLTSEQSRARPQSMYYGNPPPIYEYAEPVYKTIEPKQPIQRQLSRRSRRESLRTSLPSPEYDAELMPPPPVPRPPRPEAKARPESLRPSMRQTASAAAVYPSQSAHLRGGSSAQDVPESVYQARVSRKDDVEERSHSRSRRPSLARPSRTSEEKAVTFDDIERDMGQMNIGSTSSPTKSRRRSSVYGHESLEDAEGSIEAYQKAVRTPVAAAPSREDVIARLMREKRANALQQQQGSEDGGSRLSAQSRGSRGSKSSRDGSERVRHSSISDSKALDRRPINNDVGSVRSIESTNSEAPFALRFKPQDTNVTMAGSIDGRAISLRRSKEVEGDVELSIEAHSYEAGSRGRKASTSSSARPPLRQQSHKRYSYIEGQGGVREITGVGYESREAVGMVRVSSQQDDGEGRRVIGERIVTTVRSRRSSRYGYDGRERFEYEGRPDRYER